MKKDLFKVRLFSLAGLFGFMLTLASCANEDVVQKTTNTDNDKNLTSFMAGNPETRTSLDYNSGAFYWEAGDYIYVKDDNNVWQKSSNAPTEKTAFFRFRVPGQFTNSTTYKVYYPGKNGNENQVTIPTTQTQTEPNTTIHFGESGDCGTATANKVTGKPQFTFALDHQASYLVFQPYTNNTALQKCYLTKIEVSSDDDIAATYTLDPVNGLSGTGTGKQITLTTKGSGTYTNGFPLNTNSANVTTNGAYMVIKPGTHTFKVRYWVKDIVSNVEGTITKTLSSFNYEKNNYYDMTAELNAQDYPGDKYYLWDAKQNCWYQHEWNSATPWQGPFYESISGPPNSHYPQSKAADPDRWYNESWKGYGVRDDAVNSCKDLANANEMLWYCMKGSPHWEEDEVWTTQGHLCKGGMWFKKQARIARDNSTTIAAMKEIGPNGRDYRFQQEPQPINRNVINGRPDASEIGDYFYLPALGNYNMYLGKANGAGISGTYWSSSSFPWNGGREAIELDFISNEVRAHYYNLFRKWAYIALPFTYFGED